MFHEWARLEPERCRPHEPKGYRVSSTLFHAFEGEASDALLRVELQRALADRGWSWRFARNNAKVFVSFSDDNDLGAEGVASERPGEALLDAYLKALRLKKKSAS